MVLDSVGNAMRWDYDAAGNPIKVTDPDDYSLTFDYDAMNRPVMAMDKANHTVVTAYQLDGQPRVAVDPEGDTVSYTYYDSTKDGRLKSQLDPLNRATSYDYDPAGNVVSVTDNQAHVSRVYYDELNRPVRSVGPAVAADANRSPVTCTKYDTLGRAVELWAGATATPSGTCDFSGADPNLKKQVTYLYDDFGRKLKETDALGKVQTWQYDLYGNVIQYTDARNQTTILSWDYGHLLNTRTVKNADGSVYRTYTYIRNALGQTIRTEVKDATGKLLLATNTDYDPAHRVKRLTDLRNLGPAVFTHSLTYSYSPGGLLNTTLDNDGNRTDYLYDPVGRLTGIWAPNDDYVTFAHDKAGRLTEKWLPNGTTARYQWNADSTLASLTNRVGDTDQLILTRHSYQYDTLGRRQSALDQSGLLTQPALNQSWTYDALDNQTSASVPGTTQASVFDAANQLIELHQTTTAGPLLAAFVYDANGNLSKKCTGGTVTRTTSDCTGSAITQYSWDAEDRLIQVSAPGITETYAYDAQGRRISKTSNGTPTNDVYDGMDITAEVDNAGKRLVTYTQGPNIDDPLIRITPNQTLYYHADGQGSVVATSNVGGTVIASQLFDAWGNKTNGSASPIPTYGYTGREPDATGLIYYRARYYDPTVGRFISRDPAGMPDGVNRYAYTGNDPVDFMDPSGNIAVIDNVIGAGVAVGVDLFAQYTQAQLSGQPFNINWTRTSVAGGAGFLTSGASAFLGESVSGLGLGAASSFALRTTGNAAIGSLANVGSTATLNQLEGTNNSLGSAALWGGGFGALGSVAGDIVTGIGPATARANYNAMSVGQRNLVQGIADLSGIDLFAPTPAFVTAGVIASGAIGSGTSFIGGEAGTTASTNSLGSPNDLELLGVVTLGTTSGAQTLSNMANPTMPGSDFCLICANNDSYSSGAVTKSFKFGL